MSRAADDRAVPQTHTQELERILKAKRRPPAVFLDEKLDHGIPAYTRPTYDPDGAGLA
jgi:hypothetical protein